MLRFACRLFQTAIRPVPGAVSCRWLSTQTNAFGSKLPQIIEERGWEAAWQEGVTPWETGRPAPILSTLGSSTLPLPRGRALIPGCGAGHDALAFASAGWDTTALDLSKTAIARCLRTKNEHLSSRLPSQPEIKLTCVSLDFFTFEPSVRYDVIFDYTFVSALHPRMWPRWAQRSFELLQRESGELCVLIFPVGTFHGGPPFAMQPAQIDAVLTSAGFEQVFLEALPPEISFTQRAGREWLGRWRPSSCSRRSD